MTSSPNQPLNPIVIDVNHDWVLSHQSPLRKLRTTPHLAPTKYPANCAKKIKLYPRSGWGDREPIETGVLQKPLDDGTLIIRISSISRSEVMSHYPADAGGMGKVRRREKLNEEFEILEFIRERTRVACVISDPLPTTNYWK